VCHIIQKEGGQKKIVDFQNRETKKSGFKNRRNKKLTKLKIWGPKLHLSQK